MTTIRPAAARSAHRVRPAAALLTAVSLALSLVLCASGTAAADAVHTVVRTEGQGLWLHSTLGNDDELLVVLPEGAQLVVDCFTLDTPVLGNPVWLRVESGGRSGYVSDYYTDTEWQSTDDLVAQGIPPCGGSSEPAPSSAPSSPPVVSGDPCIQRYPGGSSSSIDDWLRGTVTSYDQEMSLYLVCQGFGAGGVTFSTEMKCALIAAGATATGVPALSLPAADACTAAGVVSALESGEWLSFAAGEACEYLGTVFATGAGIFVAGSTAATGAGAAIGVAAYRALAAGFQVACAGLFDDGAHDLGQWLEQRHEAAIAVDITTRGMCLQHRDWYGVISWSAARC